MSQDYIPPLGNLRVVSGEDPAIDLAATEPKDLIRYMGTRDMALLKFAPATLPCVYTLREMHESVYQYVKEGSTDEERWTRALEACLESVENRYNRDGSQVPGVHTFKTSEGVDGARMTLRADIVKFIRPIGARWELGHLALWRSELGPKARLACAMLRGSHSRILDRYSDAETSERMAAQLATQESASAPEPTSTATAAASDSTAP